MAARLHIGVPVGTSADDFPTVFRRDNTCVLCADGPPACPQCGDGESCQFTVLSCQACPKAYCMKDTTLGPGSGSVSSSSLSSGGGGASTGAIAGGVIGGLAAIGIVTYLVWRFCIKTRRGELESEWAPESRTKEGATMNDAATMRSARQSTHSVHSLASTVLTRASNIIQIAYIPGVTNRAAPNSPTVLVPPVPPIPLEHSENRSPSAFEDEHFFVPGNLRDSTYSGISANSDRTSYARTSYAPRSSVASTIYGKNAVVGAVQKGTLLKPSMVSVKSKTGSPNGSGGLTPPVPVVDYERFEQPPPPSPAFSIGATFLKNASASTATSVRPQVVRVGSSPKVVEVKSVTPSTTSSASPPASIAEDATTDPQELEASTGRESRTVRDSNAITIIDDSPVLDQGPFSDPPANRPSSNLSTVIEEATRRAAESRPAMSPGTLERTRSPFGDEHAVKE